MSILTDKPFFELKLNAFGVAHFIELNGVSIVKEYDSFGQVSTTFPVNHWFRSGVNVMGMYVLPENEGEAFNPNAYVSLELWVQDFSGHIPGVRIASIDFRGNQLEKDSSIGDSTRSGKLDSNRDFIESNKGDVEVGDIISKKISEYDGCFLFERKLNIPSILPEWAFFSSDGLPNYDHVSDEEYSLAKNDLYTEYRNLQQLISKGDVNSVISIVSERSTETDWAFYLEPGTTEKKLRASLEDSIRDGNLELAELFPDYVDIRIEDNKKLVRLLRGDESSAIGFNFKSIPGSLSYDFYFRRENGKWIVTR